MEASSYSVSNSQEKVVSFYRYMTREKLDDLETERTRLVKSKSPMAGDEMNETILATLIKRGPLYLQYRKTIYIKLNPIDDTYHFLNSKRFLPVTYREIEDIKALVKDVEKYKNKTTDLIDEGFIGQPQFSKKDDPSKKLKKEDILQFKKDFKKYKADNGIEENQKVFYVDEIYPFLKEELEKRGWKQNLDLNSKFFDLKYTAAFKNVDLSNLFPGQFVNHIVGSGAFVRKVGLTRNLRGSIWDCGKDADLFYPRSYEAQENGSLFNFIQDFKGVEAFNKLAHLLKQDNRIEEYKTKHYTTFLDLAVYTTALEMRVRALQSITAENSMMEISSSLLDILDTAYIREAPNSFLLNKNAVRQSKLGEYGFVPKEDFIKEFLDNNKNKPDDAMLKRLYRDVKPYNLGRKSARSIS